MNHALKVALMAIIGGGAAGAVESTHAIGATFGSVGAAALGGALAAVIALYVKPPTNGAQS